MKQDLRIAVTKRMIREALLRLLKMKPLNKIKVNELCAEAGVNRATFYRHYETLQDVLHEIEVEFIRQMPHPAKRPRNVNEAQDYMEAVCTYFYDHSDMIKLLFLNRTDADMMQGMNEFCRSFLELRKKEMPTPDMDEDTVKAIIALVGGIDPNAELVLKAMVMDLDRLGGQTAVDLIRKSGEDSVNARSIATALNCSTQPIFSNFSSIPCTALSIGIFLRTFSGS